MCLATKRAEWHGNQAENPRQAQKKSLLPVFQGEMTMLTRQTSHYGTNSSFSYTIIIKYTSTPSFASFRQALNQNHIKVQTARAFSFNVLLHFATRHLALEGARKQNRVSNGTRTKCARHANHACTIFKEEI